MNKKKDCEPYNPLPEYLAIGPSDIHGAGILAKEDIPGEVVIGISHVYVSAAGWWVVRAFVFGVVVGCGRGWCGFGLFLFVGFVYISSR